jgi:hypothetical protein
MSKLIGDRMPEEMVRALDGTDLEAKVGPAHMVLTSDRDGTPRPCMVSAGELLAVDDRRLRLVLWSGTRTGANLARGGTALVCYVTVGTVLYVRGTSRALPDVHVRGMDCFEIEVRSVESDVHPGLPVTGGLRFGLERMDRDSLVERWRSQLATLREG